MNLHEYELKTILRLLNCFEENNKATVTYNLLSNFGFGEKYLKPRLNELIERKDIEKISANGFYPTYKINTKLDCYKFILDKDLSTFNKDILCILKEYLPNYEKIKPKQIAEIVPIDINLIYRLNFRVKELGRGDIFNILQNHSGVVKENIINFTNSGLVINENKEIQIDSYGNKGEVRSKYKCRICGEENPEKFDKNRGICYSCMWKKFKHDISKNLLAYARKNTNIRSKKKNIDPNKLEFNIDSDYIQELWEKQDGKCYYTKIPFDIDDKNLAPSIDRIDSNKGYIKNNICICLSIVNKAKSDLDVGIFKWMIVNLYNNINNF